MPDATLGRVPAILKVGSWGRSWVPAATQALRIAHILYFVPRLPEAKTAPATRLALDLLRLPFAAMGARLTWPEGIP
jgi:hypothetical protein